MKQSVIKIMPIKKLGRKGERDKQCLFSTSLKYDLKDCRQEEDIKTQRFLDIRQLGFFDIRIFISFTRTHQNLSLKTCYRRNEQDNRRTKDQKVREIEHVCFMSLVWTSSGDIGHSAKVMYKLAAMIVLKHDKP